MYVGTIGYLKRLDFKYENIFNFLDSLQPENKNVYQFYWKFKK